ncbi:rod shape-determining protein MreD [Staphylococcus cohnii]|uniref:rod shape-determining protein MreD n=1 Tax=Staphylococcus cohnii TaxID=29382 RepID=UPI0030B98EAB
MYSVLGLVQFNLFEFVIFRMIPTLILNLILLIVLYPLITKFLKKIQLKIDSERS